MNREGGLWEKVTTFHIDKKSCEIFFILQLQLAQHALVFLAVL